MYELLVGGCSGSNTPAHSRPYFGHLTTSYGLLDRENKRGIVIDNGTGVQIVAKEMLKVGVVETTILQTHFHSDHMEGLQLNGLLFGKTVKEIIVPRFAGTKRFEQIFDERFHISAWPVCPDFRIKFGFREFESGKVSKLKIAGDVSVNILELNHPGSSVAYRFDVAGGIVIATDNELIGKDFRRRYAEFVSGATLLIADVQYTNAEYWGQVALGGQAMSRRDWGHSTPEMLAETLEYCKHIPKEIWLTHHDPSRTDEELMGFEQQANLYLHCKLAIPVPNPTTI